MAATNSPGSGVELAKRCRAAVGGPEEEPVHIGGRGRRGASSRSYRWAELMKRAFDVDVLVCECGSKREVISCITDRTVARRILRHLGLPDEPPTSTPPRAPPMLDFGPAPTGC